MGEKIIIGGSEVIITHRGRESIKLSIPYAFSLGAINFVGTLYVEDPLENTFTDGVWAGVVVGTYHVGKDNIEACADNGLTRACVQIRVQARQFCGRIGTRRWDGGWDDGDWKLIVSW
jgi:hypothetical protein